MDYEYSIEIQRFKKRGKYYDTVSFGTNFVWMWEIANQIEHQIAKDIISDSFIYLITGQDYEGKDLANGHPVLVNL